MTPVTMGLFGIGGMLVAGGMVLTVAAFRPAPPSLEAALNQLNASPTGSTLALAPVISSEDGDGWSWLPSPMAAALDRYLGARDEDLLIVGWTRAQLAARKVALAALGLLTPTLMGLLLILAGIDLPFAIPSVVGLVLAAFLWTLPSAEVRETAAKARAEFRTALSSFLDLVALERKARGSVSEALASAAAISECGPFRDIRAALDRGNYAGTTPWVALRDLGRRLDVEELENLGNIAEVAADGGKVYQTLTAESRALRHAQLAEARASANAASERMSMPVALLTVGLALFVLTPFVLRIFAL